MVHETEGVFKYYLILINLSLKLLQKVVSAVVLLYVRL